MWPPRLYTAYLYWSPFTDHNGNCVPGVVQCHDTGIHFPKYLLTRPVLVLLSLVLGRSHSNSVANPQAVVLREKTVVWEMKYYT